MDVFELADKNSDNLRNQFEQLRGRFSSAGNLDELNKFVELVKNEWSISINMKLGDLNLFLLTGKLKNKYEKLKEQEEELEKTKQLEITIEEAMEKHLKDYYKSRIAFDHTFEDGEKFRYCALNIGGLGIKYYGNYCVVINQEQSKTYILAFLKEDSLKRYVDDKHKVNIDLLSKEIANKENVHILAAFKHEQDIESTNIGKYMSLICCNESYIESITKDEILNNHIGNIRISKKDYNVYIDFLFKDYIHELDDSSERYLLNDFKVMQELLNQQGIELDVLDYD